VGKNKNRFALFLAAIPDCPTEDLLRLIQAVDKKIQCDYMQKHTSSGTSQIFFDTWPISKNFIQRKLVVQYAFADYSFCLLNVSTDYTDVIKAL